MTAAASVTWADPGDLAAVAARIAAEVARPGKKRIAIAGGSTPGKVLQLLAAQNLDWSGVRIVPTDDRQVPPDHPASNLGALRRAFAGTAAEILPLADGDRPARFDLVWLGMGEDGHIASLFPRMCAEPCKRRRVIAVTPIPLPLEAPFARLTLNRKALTAAEAVILVVTGRAKRTVIEHALGGADSYPVSDILRGPGPPVTIYWSE
ncbi:6-phosphogluconolactonase [Novosphingobium sp. Gsoil 351]|uniref:6-phosphogluconolactonase n=1 Tax=Novosphingobium sp. Gsoil 351 TaxID=2675225 RepID=UPI0012B4F879|nr:6-phosphogluconolactonase [Novosphingobium sp. Gsoil 351]QGN55937.1 6-phosphogluconolactonase [Novosphingobium sp. Gsoil 351]